jgi:putative cofactor-binding repeat protein
MLSAAVLTPTGYNVSSIALTGYGNPTSIEMVYEGWTHVRVPIASMTSTTITMAAYPWDRAINWAGINNTGVWFTANATPSWIENAYEFLATGSPGDWYFDKTTKILYMRPPAGVTLNSATVVIGNLQQMMVLNGSTGTLVQGIGFADCQWLEPNTNGYAGTCGAYYSTGWITPTVAGVTQDGFPTMPAAVQLIGCNNVRLLGNNFRRVSPNCINVDRGSNNNLISGNNFNAVGGCAITLSDPIYFAPIGGSCQNNVVRDNTIYAPAQEYRSCVGITPFYTDGTQIINNTIINCPYMAIPLGNGGNGGPGNSWAGPSLVRTVTVADNLIQGIMLNLHDGGGIYVREDQRGAAITGNVITGAVQGSSYNLYEDDYGANATFSGNVIVKGSGSYNWFFHNCAATSSVAGNFADQAAYANQSGSGFTPAFSPPDTIISGLSDPRVASIVAAAGAH